MEPTLVLHLLIPAQFWGLSFDPPAPGWNDRLSCGCRQPKRALLGNDAIPAAPGEDGLLPLEKLSITRTGCPSSTVFRAATSSSTG
ncbi:hypothetical protein [Synechococcus sp. CS-1332]|uniref:hypothetical protein n=1 Tax=Synechococcus sp. CS-1332 TaxID=2847972 RepID=UPI00223B95F4|nr:hypothetical protein [Synechococcus sp. CS-1332]MCT0208450.1 hypothetical protein [Synechococcus sp. CS-1332]